MTSYHEFNKKEKGPQLIEQLLQGVSIALITDAGTPGISDPGEDLVKLSLDAGIEVTSLPGPVACITALTLSGLPTRRFSFEAFLPSDKKERQQVLKELQRETRTIILYEAPHRLLKTLKELYEALGDRKITIVKEITKKYENVMPVTILEAIRYYGEEEPKGEFVLVIEGKPREEMIKEEQEQWSSMSLEEHMNLYLEQGLNKKEAMKAVSSDRGVPKREIYQQLLQQTE